MTEKSGTELDQYISQLSSKDGAEREQAREAVVQLGREAVPELLTVLDSDEPHVRWEAAKALEAIADPEAAAPLIVALGDEDSDVRWVAGQALIAIGQPVLRSLLKTLATADVPGGFYHGAHHVLHDLALRSGELSHALKPVLAAFHNPEPRVSVPVAAESVLQQDML
jgi:HEAT repeat protein